MYIYASRAHVCISLSNSPFKKHLRIIQKWTRTLCNKCCLLTLAIYLKRQHSICIFMYVFLLLSTSGFLLLILQFRLEIWSKNYTNRDITHYTRDNLPSSSMNFHSEKFERIMRHNIFLQGRKILVDNILLLCRIYFKKCGNVGLRWK